MKRFALTMLISGGQTGVDRAALDFALARGIACSGWCPKGRRAEDGEIPARYPLREANTELYQQRTRLNVKDSDATLIITDGKRSRGTELTMKCAGLYAKPVMVAEKADRKTIEQLTTWLNRVSPQILNVAGPRGSESSAIYQLTQKILEKSLIRARAAAPCWPPPMPVTPSLFNE